MSNLSNQNTLSKNPTDNYIDSINFRLLRHLIKNTKIKLQNILRLYPALQDQVNSLNFKLFKILLIKIY